MSFSVTEEYAFNNGLLTRSVVSGGFKGSNSIAVPELKPYGNLSHLWWQLYLQGKPIIRNECRKKLSILDLFCGCGGLVLGVKEAISAVSCKSDVLLSVDTDGEALDIYTHNIKPKTAYQNNVNSLIDYHVIGRGKDASFSYPPEPIDHALDKHVKAVDVLVAGPPCQGHSNLNNHTRREDPRNLLYLAAVATGVAVKAKTIIIENVPDVVNDTQQVVETSKQLFENEGYFSTDYILSANELGCPQTRRRHFLVAARKPLEKLDVVFNQLKKDELTVGWAINDLIQIIGESNFDSSPVLSKENQHRIEYLFEHNEYDLPNQIRPDCHKNGHTYPSVYGRLKWDGPSGTITTGFQTPGRGRYIHPLCKRVLTPHEAARLQSFPDSFEFSTPNYPNPSRSLLAKCIGDAVPSVLGYATGLCALTGL